MIGYAFHVILFEGTIQMELVLKLFLGTFVTFRRNGAK